MKEETPSNLHTEAVSEKKQLLIQLYFGRDSLLSPRIL